MAENKVKYGLKNVHYAVLTEGESGVTFATPVAIPGAVNLSLSAQGDETKFYADNGAYYVTAANNGYSGDLEVALLPDSFRDDILGESMETTAKVLTENANTEPKAFALLFEFDGDQKATRHVLYNCKATRPTMASQTTNSAKGPNTDTLTITASPLANGNVKAKTTSETTESVYSGWYGNVWMPSEGGA